MRTNFPTVPRSGPRSGPHVACKNRKNALFFKVLEKVGQWAYIYIYTQWPSLANSRLQECLGVLGGRGTCAVGSTR